MPESLPSSSPVSVLIPCFNEGLTIGKVVTEFHAALPGATIYVFDNNSTDGSARMAKDAGAIVIHEKRQGKGFVVATMLERVVADYYLMVDGDDTYPANRAKDLLQPLLEDRADVVVGARLPTNAAAFPRFHTFGNYLVRTLVNLCFNGSLSDVMSGYRAFTREVALKLPVLSRGFDIETEMSIHCLRQKWTVREIAVEYRDRPAGSESKLRTVRDGLRVLRRIAGAWIGYNPLRFCGVVAIISLVAACVLAIRAAGANKGAALPAEVSSMLPALALGGLAVIALGTGFIAEVVNLRFAELQSVVCRRRGVEAASRFGAG